MPKNTNSSNINQDNGTAADKKSLFSCCKESKVKENAETVREVLEAVREGFQIVNGILVPIIQHLETQENNQGSAVSRERDLAEIVQVEGENVTLREENAVEENINITLSGELVGMEGWGSSSSTFAS